MPVATSGFSSAGYEDRDHVVITYNSEPQLTQEVVAFLRRGLQRARTNVLFVKRTDGENYLEILRNGSIDVDDLLRSQSIILVPVDEWLEGTEIEKIMGLVEDWVGRVTEVTLAKDRKGINVVGRIAGTLAAQGRFDDCVALEQWWQQFISKSSIPITLLCPYPTIPSGIETYLHSSHRSMTRFFSGPQEKVASFVASFVQRARSNALEPALEFVGDRYSPTVVTSVISSVSRLGKMHPDFKFRMLTSIEPENAAEVAGLIAIPGVEIKHLKGINSNFLVSRSEYISTTGTLKDGLPAEVIWSNSADLIAQMRGLFQVLWQSAIPADLRLGELTHGDSFGETRVTFDLAEIMNSAERFVDELKQEALVIIPREGSLTENSDFFRRMATKAKREGATVKILGRFSNSDRALLEELEHLGGNIRSSELNRQIDIVVGIYDRRGMGMVQYLYPDPTYRSIREGGTSVTGIISTSRAMISGIASIFDSLWEESELRETAEAMRRRAELMQDIMAHDIRNYNQVAMANAEFLLARVEDETLRSYLSLILDAVQGSTALVQRARQLAGIVSQKDPVLSPMILNDSIARSLSLIRMGNPKKTIELKPTHGQTQVAWVVADELLDEVFVNILSNAVKYTNTEKVVLDVRTEEQVLKGQQYWMVSITDRGSGIPDAVKENVTMRYLGSTRGRGLGLSIIRALVVDRYGGTLEIKDRVRGDYSKGTSVIVRLPKASQ